MFTTLLVPAAAPRLSNQTNDDFRACQDDGDSQHRRKQAKDVCAQ